jgi:hypothetical protein
MTTPDLNPIPPLPQEFDELQRSIDTQLRQTAHQTIVPMGLSDRVFEASVMLLPRQASEPVEIRSLRLVGTERSIFNRLAWGRLAMAASVLIAAGVGVWMVNQSAPSPVVGPGTIVFLDPQPSDSALAAEFATLPEGAASDVERELSYLLDTNELTSFDDLTGELALLVADLGSMRGEMGR